MKLRRPCTSNGKKTEPLKTNPLNSGTTNPLKLWHRTPLKILPAQPPQKDQHPRPQKQHFLLITITTHPLKTSKSNGHLKTPQSEESKPHKKQRKPDCFTAMICRDGHAKIFALCMTCDYRQGAPSPLPMKLLMFTFEPLTGPRCKFLQECLVIDKGTVMRPLE